MTERKGPIKVKVHDKRRTSEGRVSAAEPDVPASSATERAAEQADLSSASRSSESSASSPRPDETSGGSQQEEKNYEDLYVRAVADLDNERKRFKMREREQAERAVRALIESLLPVLDNFERAISHGEGGEGVALVFKEFKAVLEREGLEEIPTEGAEFDPNVHEAVESRVTPGLEVPTIVEVYRRGYLLNGQVVRAAMVVVGRPDEPEQAAEQE